MLRFLVLLNDMPLPKQGASGCTLYTFLQLFVPAHEVAAIAPSELDARRPLSTDVLLIGLPTSLQREQLRGVRYRQSALFDYFDSPAPVWGDSDEGLLRSLTDIYLRPFVDRSLDFGLRMGTLPLYRKPNLARCIRASNLYRTMTGRAPSRRHDVCFFGSPTRIPESRDGQVVFYDQRVEWLLEVTAPESPFALFGGLAPCRAERHQLAELRAKYGDLDRITWGHRRINFFSYFYHLSRSKVALVPAGNGRWTYRHYEAIYAGAAVVSTDFRHCDLLVPLPKDGILMVPDHAPVTPAVVEAMRWHEEYPDRLEENRRFLETYFTHGRFSPNKPAAFERLVAQLPLR
jgi:hypothetical protein